MSTETQRLVTQVDMDVSEASAGIHKLKGEVGGLISSIIKVETAFKNIKMEDKVPKDLSKTFEQLVSYSNGLDKALKEGNITMKSGKAIIEEYKNQFGGVGLELKKLNAEYTGILKSTKMLQSSNDRAIEAERQKVALARQLAQEANLAAKAQAKNEVEAAKWLQNEQRKVKLTQDEQIARAQLNVKQKMSLQTLTSTVGQADLHINKLKAELGIRQKAEQTEANIAKIKSLQRDIANKTIDRNVQELKTQQALNKENEREATYGSVLSIQAAKRAVGYSLLFGGIAAVTTAVKEMGTNFLEADLSMRTMGAVLDLNATQASSLATKVRDLGSTYGGSLSAIDSVALSLGRAGLATKDIIPATEIVLKMARLTGDTFEQSASAIISFQQVFGNTTNIELLGDKLAYIANVSRLSTQDIGTFANYALAAAQAVGLTEDAVGGLAAAFSNAGVNASTIGTQIRTFSGILTEQTTDVKNFFSGIGINQQELAARVAAGGKTSNDAIRGFVDVLQDMDDMKFNGLTGQMDKLTANVLNLMRNNGDNIDKFIAKLQDGVEGELNATDKILEAHLVTFESYWNKFLSSTNKFFTGGGTAIGDTILAMQIAELENSVKRVNKYSEEEISILQRQLKEKQALRDITALQLRDEQLTVDLSKASGAEYSKILAKQIEGRAKIIAIEESLKVVSTKSAEEAAKHRADISQGIKDLTEKQKLLKEANQENTPEYKAQAEALKDMVETIDKLNTKSKGTQLIDLGGFNPKELAASVDMMLKKGIEPTEQFLKFIEDRTSAVIGKASEDTQSLLKLNEKYTQEYSATFDSMLMKIEAGNASELDFVELKKQQEILRTRAVELQAESVALLKDETTATLESTKEHEAKTETAVIAANKFETSMHALMKLFTTQNDALGITEEMQRKINNNAQKIADKTTGLELSQVMQEGLKAGLKESKILEYQIDLLQSKKLITTDESAILEHQQKIENFRTQMIQKQISEKEKGARASASNSKQEEKALEKELKIQSQINELQLRIDIAKEKTAGRGMDEETIARKLYEVKMLSAKEDRDNISDKVTGQKRVLELLKAERTEAEAKVELDKTLYELTEKKLIAEQQRAEVIRKMNESYSNLQNFDATGGVSSAYGNALTGVSNSEEDLALKVEAYTRLYEAKASVQELDKAELEILTANTVLLDAKMVLKREELELSKAIFDQEILGQTKLGKLAISSQKIGDDMLKAKQTYNQEIKDAKGNTDALAKIEAKYSKAQLKGYGDMAGAMSTMFKEGSREAAAFQAVQTGLALVTAVQAVMTAGTGDPYTAIPRMIAVAAMAGTFLSQIGVAFGGGSMKDSISYGDSVASQKVNEGKGSILGDTDKVSKSIEESLGILRDFAKPEFSLLSQMNKHLASISNRMGGMANLLIQQGGFAFGEGFSPTSTGWQNNVKIGSGAQQIGGMALGAGIGALAPMASIGSAIGLFGGAAAGAAGSALTAAGIGAAGMGAIAASGVGLAVAAVDKLLLGGAITKTIGKVINKVSGALFGKKSVEQTLEDAGLYFGGQSLEDALNNMNGKSYQTVKTTTTKKSLFKKSSSTRYDTYYSGLDSETNNQFTMLLNDINSTLYIAGEALGHTTEDIESQLKSFVVNIGKISLKGKSGQQIQELISGVVGKLSDDMTKKAYPALVGFQQIGEGMFQTLTRVSAGIQESEYFISRLGKAFGKVNYQNIIEKQGDVGFEALLQSIVKADTAAFGLNNSLIGIIENLDSTAEELYSAYIMLDELRARLIFLKQDLNGLTTSMIYGAGSLEALQQGFNDFFKNFLSEEEQVVYQTGQMIKEFNKLNIALPVSKEAFKQLLGGLDLTTESGQELYGRLIVLSGAFASVADEVEKSIKALEDQMEALKKQGKGTINDIFKDLFKSISQMGKNTIDLINNLKNKNESEDMYAKLIRYNSLIADFKDSSLNGNIQDTEAIYSQLLALSGELGKDDTYTNDILRQLEENLAGFDLGKETIRVNVVEGLGQLEGLTEEQIKQLTEAGKDGKLTNVELNSISSLNRNQWLELLSINESGIKVTDAQLSSISGLTTQQLNELKQANKDGVITVAELGNIKGLSANQISQLTTMNTEGLRVTDFQIQNLLGISQEQKNALIKANADGLITNEELKQIVGLTQIQKNGITEFVNNSEYFSTESTLNSLNEYMRKQLEVLTKKQEEETARLSSKTLTHGDYIGAQEQIDISKTLGMTYTAAKPLIENMQNLNVSKNLQADVNKMLGFTAGDMSYDATKYSQFESLSPYLSKEINTAVGSVKTQANANKTNKVNELSNSIASMQAQIPQLTAQINKENLEETIWSNYKALLYIAHRFRVGGFDYGSEHGQNAQTFASRVTGKTLPRSIRYGGGINYDQYAAQIQSEYQAKLKNIPISSTGIMDVSKYYIAPVGRWVGGIDHPNLSGLEGQQALVNQLNSLKAAMAGKQSELAGVRGYAVGTSNITQDHIAQVHKGEIIVPKTFSEGIRSGDLALSKTDISRPRVASSNITIDNDDLILEIRALRRENEDMKKLMITLTANSSKQLNTQRALLSVTMQEGEQ